MQLAINDDEFRIIYRALGRALYHTVEERTETLKLYSRLHHAAVPNDLAISRKFVKEMKTYG